MRTTGNSKLTKEQAEIFGTELRKRRKDSGVTLKDFGSLVGCTGEYISNIEGGSRKPSPQLTDRILDVLGVELSDMLNDTNQTVTEEVLEERKQYGKKLFESRISRGLTRGAIAGALGIPTNVYVGYERGDCSILDRHKELLDKILCISTEVAEKQTPVEEPVVAEEPTADLPIDICNIILGHIKDLQVDVDTQKKVWRFFTDMKINAEERRLFG